ncbi:MAG: WG repeat-containing protein [Bacillota bacterium]
MKYKSILPFIGEYAVVSVESDKYGVIDRSANVIVPPTWDMIEYAGGDFIAVSVGFCRGGDCCDEDDGIWRIRSLSGRETTQTDFAALHPWGDSNHFTAVDLETDLFGVVDIDGEIVIPFEYDYLSFYGPQDGKDWLYAHKNGKYGYITIRGEVAIPLIYDNISPIFRESSDDWLTVEKDGECYYINQKGERVLL